MYVRSENPWNPSDPKANKAMTGIKKKRKTTRISLKKKEEERNSVLDYFIICTFYLSLKWFSIYSLYSLRSLLLLPEYSGLNPPGVTSLALS